MEEQINMKKAKLLTIALVLVMMLSFSMVVSAIAGPFNSLAEATQGKTWLQREFVVGAEDYWGGVGIGGEGPHNLANDDVDFKYGGGGAMLPFWAVWKYDKAYIADSFVFATANDNSSNGRRMDDGWTISGGNSADGPWTVLYTGKGDDYETDDFTFWRVDLPNNKDAFQFYRLYAEDGYDNDAIQLSVAGVTVKDAVAPAAAVAAPFTVKAADFVNYAGWDGSTDGDARRDDADVAIETGGSQFGSNVGWTDQGEWLEYHINVPGPGKYVAKAWLASDSSGNQGIELLFKGEIVGASGPVEVKGWQVYDLYTLGEIDLVAGIQTVRVDVLSGGFNISALEFVPVGWVEAPAVVEEAPVEVVDDNASGGGAAADAEIAPVVVAPPPQAPAAAPTGNTAIVFFALMFTAGVFTVTRRFVKAK